MVMIGESDGMIGYVFFQAEDGIRDLVRSRGLGDVYKRQEEGSRENVRHARTIMAWPTAHRSCGCGTAGSGDELSLIHI